MGRSIPLVRMRIDSDPLQERKSMQRIAPMSIAIVVAVAILSGATYAYFSDSEEIQGNVFTTGTLEIDVEKDLLGEKLPLYLPEEDGLFYPSSGEVVKTLLVKNVGTLAFKMRGFRALFYNDTILAEGLRIKIEELDRVEPEISYTLYTGWLSDLGGEGVLVAGVQSVVPPGSVLLRFTIWMPTEAGDVCQGLYMRADLIVEAIQATAP